MSRSKRSTCQRCGRSLRAARKGWLHVPPGDSCSDADAAPVTPGAALRTLLLALLATGACQVVLYSDGIEVEGPDDTSLLFVGGDFTVDQVAALLGIPVEAVDAKRRRPRPSQPGDHPNFTRHDLTDIGESVAWRYQGVPGDGDLSDHFWLAVLGVEVMVRRRNDGVYVSIENDAIDTGHGPLLVEVDQGGANTYGEDTRDE
ncbi:hypothetical protein Asi02nite_76270 [Asanoa siamensis]|uniref:Uncharacterized protein n=1 Tax=Asanoa siamensis TaxID=926357 RepID=A0ABQ4D3J9_9ACTN|nr:hypothetical protein Asi02nite_76270 [Asanoa siamensis]